LLCPVKLYFCNIMWSLCFLLCSVKLHFCCV
jgi:hypothetical protein